MKNKLAAVFTAFCLIFLITACGQPTPLPEGVDPDKIEQRSIEYVGYANSRDYESLAKEFVDDNTYEETLTGLQSIDPYITTAGEFKEIKKISVEAHEDDKIVCYIQCSYSKTKYNFFVNYDADLNLVGFFLRTEF